METTTGLNTAKTRGIMVSTHDGTVSISGLGNGETVKFYSADGRLVGSTTSLQFTRKHQHSPILKFLTTAE